MTTSRASRAASSTQPPSVKKFSLNDITGRGSGLPNRYALHAVEGFGKTSLGAKFPKPIFIMGRGETGLETLIDAGRLPETPHFPVAESWLDVIGAVEFLADSPHEFKTVVIDTANSIERLMHEHVCEVEFGGDWSDKGFTGYMRGYEISMSYWRELLGKLDRLREERKMTVVLLSHTKVKNFKNPEGADYDRYQADMHEKTWGLTSKWADVVLFGNFSVTVVQGKRDTDVTKKGKGQGGSTRVLYTERTAAFDAKNRIGLPHEIELGDTPESAWEAFIGAVRQARASQAVKQPEVVNA